MKTWKIDLSDKKEFELSPHLFMQFMEALGCTDPSLEIAWDFHKREWREDVIEKTRELAPGLLRWPGGILTAYYHWREAIGPYEGRKPMYNLEWNGMESNQIGTHEYIDFCRKVGADPLLAVNFASEGVKGYMIDPAGSSRVGTAAEAAEWVDYCNNPDSQERIQNGAADPFNVKLWQIGNETSYGRGFTETESAEKTVAFAKAMRQADPSIDVIGWGDQGWDGEKSYEWAPKVIEIAGEHLQYLAFHHHWDSGLDNSPLTPDEYRNDPDKTWHHLMNAHKSVGKRLDEMKALVAGTDLKLAMTEGHFALPGEDRCDVLSSWAAGVAYARVLNEQVRRGDVLKIATMADFCGSIWNVNALMIPSKRFGEAYLMPVSHVMALYRKHMGTHAVACSIWEGSGCPLDITASRTGNTYYLYVINTDRTRDIPVDLSVAGVKPEEAKAFIIAEDPGREINTMNRDIFNPKEKVIDLSNDFAIPAASVTAIEMTIKVVL